MPSRARRLPARSWRGHTRRALLALCLWSAFLPGAAGAADLWKSQPLSAARFTEPTARYPHGVLGDTIEYGALELQYAPAAVRYVIRLPDNRVFEDVEPRLADIDGDGRREAIVVESDRDRGARLAIYNGGGLVAATPFIGRRFRWLAPVGTADLDGDGHVEIAYVDRPHLAKTLRVWQWRQGTLVEIAARAGLTNHRIGERHISGGIRDCGEGPEMITANADWSRIVATRLEGGRLTSREIGPHRDQASFRAALACR